ncbi:peroxisomal membrane protein PMP22-like [Iris pallida]|uniref:Peroxisomal membrane protein PMP22-like n=1 Tax=Iris pallida TaxID=29817 RepID=A0AAX6EFM4_IRIPA|nr:peroxisomal membrane protein PMP22-like [Iris pallida]
MGSVHAPAPAAPAPDQGRHLRRPGRGERLRRAEALRRPNAPAPPPPPQGPLRVRLRGALRPLPPQAARQALPGEEGQRDGGQEGAAGAGDVVPVEQPPLPALLRAGRRAEAVAARQEQGQEGLPLGAADLVDVLAGRRVGQPPVRAAAVPGRLPQLRRLLLGDLSQPPRPVDRRLDQVNDCLLCLA